MNPMCDCTGSPLPMVKQDEWDDPIFGVVQEFVCEHCGRKERVW